MLKKTYTMEICVRIDGITLEEANKAETYFSDGLNNRKSDLKISDFSVILTSLGEKEAAPEKHMTAKELLEIEKRESSKKKEK